MESVLGFSTAILAILVTTCVLIIYRSQQQMSILTALIESLESVTTINSEDITESAASVQEAEADSIDKPLKIKPKTFGE